MHFIIIEYRKTICINTCCECGLFTVDKFPNVYGSITQSVCVQHERRTKMMIIDVLHCLLGTCNVQYRIPKSNRSNGIYSVRTTNGCTLSCGNRFVFGSAYTSCSSFVSFGFGLIECQQQTIAQALHIVNGSSFVTCI